MIKWLIAVLLLSASPAFARDCNNINCAMCAVRYGSPAGYELYRSGGRGSYGGYRLRRAQVVSAPVIVHQAPAPMIVSSPKPKTVETVAPTLATKVEQTFVPTPLDAVDQMLDLAGIQPNDVIYDPGCGDGRILLRAAERFGVSGVGLELNPETLALAESAVTESPFSDRVWIYGADATKWTVDEATVVCCYLYPETLAKLVPIFQRLAPGARIVSYSHDLPGLNTRKIILGERTFYLHIRGE